MRHSKYLNSGLLAFLVENILVQEIVAKKNSNDRILKYTKLLNKLQNVKNELNIFDQLSNTVCNNRNYANKFLVEIKKDINKIDKQKILKERQQFFDNITNIFPEINVLLSNKINEYRTFASIKNFIDDALNEKLNAKERIIIHESIINNLMNNKVSEYSKMISEANKIPDDVDGLTLNIMLSEFLNKWKKIFTATQYKYLLEYVSSGEAINEKWKRKIIGNLEKRIENIEDENIANKTKTILERVHNNYNSENILEYCELIDALKEGEK